MARIWNKHKQLNPPTKNFGVGAGTPLKRKVFVAMSGGVDSSVAAALLVKAGYDVTGAFMVNYNDARINADELRSADSADNKCWAGDYRDALRVAAKLGIPLLRLDFAKEYKRDVLNYMYKEYAAGRTPNPDVLCNKFVKFGAWMDWAKKHRFQYLATGHYARLRKGKSYKLLEAKDKNKDQTYFLHQLSQEQLRRVLFPIGNYTKPEVRALANKFGLPTAEKEESMGICFVGEVNIKEFLKKKIKSKPGKIILSDGTEVGEHGGLPFYTIGERIGVGQGGQKSYYVIGKHHVKNELMVGHDDDPALFSKETKLSSIHWINKIPKFPFKCEVRLRHRQPLQKCVVRSGVLVKFVKPQRAVTPGQFAVLYKKGECLGGGVIS